MIVTIDEIIFDCSFEGSNIEKVERRNRNDFNIIVRDENPLQKMCTWFSFSVTSTSSGERHLCFFIRNLMNQMRLFTVGQHRPVYKDRNEWRRIPVHEWVGCTKSDPGCTVRFRHRFLKGIRTYFAFCFPYSYEECQRTLNQLEETHSNKLQRSILCHSLQGRVVDMISIGPEDPGTPTVVISARVHPGETPGQYMFFGLMKFLLSDNSVAVQLRKQYTFKLIPMLNPDGVAMGRYRTNSVNLNLNRFYKNPGPEHEAIGFMKKMIAEHNTIFFLDFHGHANKRGVFCYGNDLPLPRKEEMIAMMEKIGTFSSYFEPSICSFNAANTNVKDKRASDDETTEGSSRHQIYVANPWITHSYTLESHYALDYRYRSMGPTEWEGIGEAICKAIAVTEFRSIGAEEYNQKRVPLALSEQHPKKMNVDVPGEEQSSKKEEDSNKLVSSTTSDIKTNLSLSPRVDEAMDKPRKSSTSTISTARKGSNEDSEESKRLKATVSIENSKRRSSSMMSIDRSPKGRNEEPKRRVISIMDRSPTKRSPMNLERNTAMREDQQKKRNLSAISMDRNSKTNAITPMILEFNTDQSASSGCTQVRTISNSTASTTTTVPDKKDDCVVNGSLKRLIEEQNTSMDQDRTFHPRSRGSTLKNQSNRTINRTRTPLRTRSNINRTRSSPQRIIFQGSLLPLSNRSISLTPVSTLSLQGEKNITTSTTLSYNVTSRTTSTTNNINNNIKRSNRNPLVGLRLDGLDDKIITWPPLL